MLLINQEDITPVPVTCLVPPSSSYVFFEPETCYVPFVFPNTNKMVGEIWQWLDFVVILA